MTAADLTAARQRLEAERLTPAPGRTRQDIIADLLGQLIAVLDHAIAADERAGTWGARGR